MPNVGAAAAVVARSEFGRFAAYFDADGADDRMHMLDRARVRALVGPRTADGLETLRSRRGRYARGYLQACTADAPN